MDSSTAYEITDNCEAIVVWLLDHLRQNKIPISTKDGEKLDKHLSRLQVLYEQIGYPLQVNPINSRLVTAIKRPDNETEPRHTLSSTMDEVQELHDMNVELLEVLTVIGTRFFEYTKKYDIKIEGIESLVALISKATRLVEEIGTPYRGNPVMKRDVTKSYQNQESLQKMEPSNSYPPSAVRRFFGPARKRFS